MSEGGEMKTFIIVAAIVFLAVGWLVTVIRSGDKIEYLKTQEDIYKECFNKAKDDLKTTRTQLEADELMIADRHFLTVGYCSECSKPTYSEHLQTYFCDGREKSGNGYCDEFQPKKEEVPEFMNKIINLSEVSAK